MPRKSKAQATPADDPPVQPNKQPLTRSSAETNLNEQTPATVSKEDYMHARSVIKQYRETKKTQPKRKCSEAQLAALAAGRARNSRIKKTD